MEESLISPITAGWKLQKDFWPAISTVMKMFLFLKKKGKAINGFTLIELLVVIAIIGVLASIVLASLNNARRKSRDARRITDVKQIQLALELYFDGTGANAYPPSNANACGAAELGGLQALTTPNVYIPQVPRDPLSNGSNNCYAYAAPAAPATTYHLGATLEDITNNALTGDADLASAGWAGDFSGLDANGPGLECDAVAPGTAQPGGTETCYDLRP